MSDNPKAGIPETDPKEVTGQFDHLATRDPAAMEQALQRPEYEGAQSVETIGGVASGIEAVVPASGLGSVGLTSAAVAGAQADTLGTPLEGRNPGYTPPSQMAPPHLTERPADLPAGETEEI